MKTLALFVDTGSPDEPIFFELDGDYQRFHNCFINKVPESPEEEKFTAEMQDLIYDANGNFLLPVLKAPTLDWDFFIVCGFYS